MIGYHDDHERNDRRDARRLLPHRRRRAPATPTATSPTSAAPTTCSRPRDYRIRPFELESVLIEHEAVAEAAVVPAPDPLRLAVPKAYVVLAGGYEPEPRDAAVDPAPLREKLAPYKRIRRLRVRRAAEDDQRQDPPGRTAKSRSRTPGARPEGEYREEDFVR